MELNFFLLTASVLYYLVLSPMMRAEVLELRSLCFYNLICSSFLCKNHPCFIRLSQLSYLKTTSAVTIRPCMTLLFPFNQVHGFCSSYCYLEAISITRPLEYKNRSNPYSCLNFKVQKKWHRW